MDTYGDVAEKYAAHPEAKALGPDGEPCRRGTVGLLQRRPVIAGEIKLIGKESNRLEDRFTGLLTIDELDERLTVYHDNDGWRRFTLPKLQAMGSRKVAEAVGISERRARDILKGRAMPHARRRLQLEEFIRRSLILSSPAPPSNLTIPDLPPPPGQSNTAGSSDRVVLVEIAPPAVDSTSLEQPAETAVTACDTHCVVEPTGSYGNRGSRVVAAVAEPITSPPAGDNTGSTERAKVSRLRSDTHRIGEIRDTNWSERFGSVDTVAKKEI